MKNLNFLTCFMAIIIFLATAIPSMAQNTINIPENTQKNNSEYILKSEFQISAINPTPFTNPVGAYYPGLRATNQLIIYTPKYGAQTQTNEFGKEAIVRNGVITELAGSNSLISSDGFVISGHGRAKNWIAENLIEGAVVRINYEKNIIESVITSESYTFRANRKINEVKNLLTDYKKSSKNYKAVIAEKYLAEAVNNLNLAKNCINAKNYAKVKDFSNLSAELADYALYYTVPSEKNEFHGIWLRPVEKNRQEIAKTLDKLREAGIDNIFIETYYHGYTIFPSKTMQAYGFIAQRKEFEGWNPLQVWLEEAHARNMKIHVWFQAFYAGNEDISKNPKHILSLHPEWANVQLQNYQTGMPMPSRSEHNGYFIDPANPEAQKFLSCLLTEIVTDYNTDGLNIDYIRYPASLRASFPNYIQTTWGYTNYARNEFFKQYGVDPVTLTLEDSLWQKWADYRQNKVTDFVANLKSIVGNKKILISAVIFPDMEESSVLKLQNWQAWGKNGLVDAFTPLIMGSDEILAENYVKQIINNTDKKILVLPGLFEPFGSGSPADMLNQIRFVRKAGAKGVIIFDNAHLSKEFTTALQSRVFKNQYMQIRSK